MKLRSSNEPGATAPRITGWLTAGLLLAVCAIPTQAFAQCAGAVDINNDGTDLNSNGIPDYLAQDLSANVLWTLNPRAGGTLNVTVDQVRFALSCYDNGDVVPCNAPGNDGQAGNAALTPLQYTQGGGAGNPTGSCNATLASVTAGVVTFNLPEASLDGTGCSIEFATELQDYGIDSTPNFITPAVAFNGSCAGGLDGSAAGSAAIEIVDPAIEVLKEGPDLAKVGDEFNYEISFTVLSDPELLGECTLDDPTLNINQVVVPDQVYTFPYTPSAGDPNPLENTATVTCLVENSASTVVDDDSWTVPYINPAIEVDKSAPPTAKIGDEFNYEISFTALADGAYLGECTLDDPTLNINQVVVPGQVYTFPYTPQAGDPNPLENTATVTCAVNGFDNEAEDDDMWSVDLIGPAIEVTKTGPPMAKVGDEFNYEISFTALADGASLGECTLDDPTLNINQVVVPGQVYTFPYTPQAGDPNPLENTATVTCAVNGFDNEAEDDDMWSVDLIAPAIEVTKSAPDTAKVGDEFNYEISFTALADGAYLGVCTLDDPTLGVNQVVDPDTVYTFPYTAQAGDPNPLENTATVTCTVNGFDNEAEDDDMWSVDLINPSVMLTKECTPDPVLVGGTIEWAITVDNTGDIDLECLVNDPTAALVDEPVSVAAGGTEVVTASRTVELADAPVISNTATVVCPVPGFSNEVDDEGTADCEVLVVEEFCRTPGFWGTHAGEEKEGRSNNLTQAVIDAGGPLDICGQEITNTFFDAVGDTPSEFNSAVEAMCVHPKGKQQRQLARQLTAASLNCIVFGAGADCAGSSIAAEFAAANAACEADADDLSQHIEIIDAFNNSEDCHEAPFSEYPVFDQFDKVPGPAGSSRACSAAVKNETYVVPATP